jgi:hypothetical protein
MGAFLVGSGQRCHAAGGGPLEAMRANPGVARSVRASTARRSGEDGRTAGSRSAVGLWASGASAGSTVVLASLATFSNFVVGCSDVFYMCNHFE